MVMGKQSWMKWCKHTLKKVKCSNTKTKYGNDQTRLFYLIATILTELSPLWNILFRAGKKALSALWGTKPNVISRDNLCRRCLFGGESSQYHYSRWNDIWIHLHLQTLNKLRSFYSQNGKTIFWCIYFHKYEAYYCLNQGTIFVGDRWFLFIVSR